MTNTTELIAQAKANRIAQAKANATEEVERRLARIDELRARILDIAAQADRDIAECEKRIANNVKLNENEGKTLAKFEDDEK